MRQKIPIRKKRTKPACDLCSHKDCKDDKNCFDITEDILKAYHQDNLRVARAASKIEGRYYMQKTRLEEILLFAYEMGYRKLGVAFCIGLSEEASILCRFLRKEFDVISLCCKACAIEKNILDLQKINPEATETMCNPIGQAMILNREKTDLNLICGLCIGHDILFTEYCQAPVSTFIVKDRVLGHNPAVSLYCRYLRKRLDSGES